MKQPLSHIKRSIRFRRWSRKGYAVFCSLSADVTIGRVCKSICEMALRKSGQGICRQGGCGLLRVADDELEGTEDFEARSAEGVVCLEQQAQALALSRVAADAVACLFNIIIYVLTRGGWHGAIHADRLFYVS